MDAERQLHEEFERFYRAHLNVVLAFCFGRMHDPELAADLTAETFAAALISRGEYSAQRGSPRQWLLGIAAHKCSDALRRGHVERRAQRRLGMAEITWSEDDLRYVTEVESGSLQQLVDQLPEPQRTAVRAHVVDELGYGELARVAGVSEPTIRKRVSRGLAALRRQLDQER